MWKEITWNEQVGVPLAVGMVFEESIHFTLNARKAQTSSVWFWWYKSWLIDYNWLGIGD